MIRGFYLIWQFANFMKGLFKKFVAKKINCFNIIDFFLSSGMTQPQDLVTSLRTIYGNIVQANGGGGLETGQELEFSILIFNVGVMTMDRKHFAVAEMILSRLYNAFHPTSGSSPTKDKLDQSSMVKEELLPLLITLNLLTKNTTKVYIYNPYQFLL